MSPTGKWLPQLAEKESTRMSSVQPLKPLLSALIALIWLGCFVFIDAGPNGYLQHGLNFDHDGANAMKWFFIILVGLIWLLFQVFMDAPAESSRLAIALSGSILWLGLILFYRFSDRAFGGTVAFFALVGGLAVVIVWTRYLADEF